MEELWSKTNEYDVQTPERDGGLIFQSLELDADTVEAGQTVTATLTAEVAAGGDYEMELSFAAGDDTMSESNPVSVFDSNTGVTVDIDREYTVPDNAETLTVTGTAYKQ